MQAIAAEGARNHGLLNIAPADFFETIVSVPKDIEEQRKIGAYIMQLDHLITLHQKKCFECEKRRFSSAPISWEQRKLGELALFNPKDELPQTFEYVDLESVVGTEMLSHRTEVKSSAPSRAQRLAHTGDLFYQTVRPYQKNNYLFEKPDNNYVFSTGYTQMRPYVDGYFLLSLVQSERFVKVVLDNCTGTSYPAINANDLAEIEVAAPSDESEAQKIGTMFRSIDNLITLHQRKLELLKRLRNSLVDRCFIGEKCTMSKLILYHGSPNRVIVPKFGFGEDRHDYGRGFYLTENLELAKEWAVCRPDETNGWVHKYELEIDGLNILDFQKYDVLSWLAELMKHRDAADSRRYKMLAQKFIDKYGIDTCGYDVITGWRANASYFYIAKEFVRDNIDIEILEELLSLGGLGIQFCIKSERAFAQLSEVEQDIMSVDYSEFNDRYNERDINARNKMRALVDSDANKVTHVFSTLFER